MRCETASRKRTRASRRRRPGSTCMQDSRTRSTSIASVVESRAGRSGGVMQPFATRQSRTRRLRARGLHLDAGLEDAGLARRLPWGSPGTGSSALAPLASRRPGRSLRRRVDRSGSSGGSGGDSGLRKAHQCACGTHGRADARHCQVAMRPLVSSLLRSAKVCRSFVTSSAGTARDRLAPF